MGFSESERKALLSVRSIGPAVVAHLERMGFSSFKQLALADVSEIVATVADFAGSTSRTNSPVRTAIQLAVDLAQAANFSAMPVKDQHILRAFIETAWAECGDRAWAEFEPLVASYWDRTHRRSSEMKWHEIAVYVRNACEKRATI